MLTGPGLLAAGLAGAAAWLVTRPPATITPTGRGGPTRLVLGLVTLSLAVIAPGADLFVDFAAPAGLLAGAVVAALALRSRVHRRSRMIAVGAGVQIACEGMATSLAAGVPVDTALEVAAADWPPLAVVTRSHRLGGAVPVGLRELAAEVDGGDDLRLIAAAWQVAERGGAGLAPAVSSVATLIRRRQATRRLVRSELASARATAQLLAGLPVLTLMLGAGLGGDPVGFVFGTGPGLLCLAGGLVAALSGLWWIEAIAGSVERET